MSFIVNECSFKTLDNSSNEIIYNFNPMSFIWSDYHAVETIGTGTEGRVLKLKHLTSDHYITAKISLNRNNWNELKILQLISHDNIVNVLGCECTVDHRIIYLEYVEGETLTERILNSNEMKISDLFPIYYQIFEALEYLHSNMIAHMDLKPDNILIQASGQVKIIDFGNSLDFSKIPSIKGPVGSYEFGAPEINLDRFYHGFPCDVFSLHLIVATAILGKLCWSRAHISDSSYLEWTSQDSKTEIFQGVCLSLFQFLKRVLVHDPVKRPTLSQIKKDKWFIHMESKFIK